MPTACGFARDVIARLSWGAALPPGGRPPRYAADELLGIMPPEHRTPVDMREVIARFADDSDFLDFKPDYGPATVCGHAAVQGFAVGIVTNNGPLDPAGATKATHFIQTCCQAGLPILYLQNTTGYIVGKASEEAGMIKHGSKMIQAVSNANVPQITLMCGASFGAGNYGMCGRAYNPRFLFSWPNAQTAVMGAEQAALTMANVMEAGARRKGQEPDTAQIEDLKRRIVGEFPEPERRLLDLGTHARRRHHRPARHPQCAGLRAVDLPRSRRPHAAPGAVRRGPAMKSLLVANRGEIARRIMRTARRIGIRTIAIYSDADRDALHVREADSALRIGGAAPRESYLNIAAIIAAAKKSGAAAVHPGYGFLAENADFAQAVIDAGLVWVGPPPAVIRQMGDKAQAKRIARSAGVPTIPGAEPDDQTNAGLTAAALPLGFPLMIKAAAGGGGRGMRLVTRDGDLTAALEAARSEAQHAFGNGHLLLERALEGARHIEVQVFADRHGNIVHLGERDCSVQRRHQKLIEESPSPGRRRGAAREAWRRGGRAGKGGEL